MFEYMYTNEMDKDEIIKQLQDELYATKQELSATKEHLKKYTAPERNKKYYEANKEVIKERNYKPPVISPEKRKEYARRAYLKQKEKRANENI